MFIYLFQVHDEEGSSNYHLTHETIAPDEYQTLIETIIARLIPEEIQRKKEYVEKEWMRHIEMVINEPTYWPSTEEKQSLIAHCTEQYNGRHSIKFGDLYFKVVEILKNEYHFQEFKFDGVCAKSYWEEVIAFEMEKK